ncbi:MAG: 4Fe-4S binding protein [Coriobacteriales bacterium]|nr:4Fe-4S binding protein [Coriobacteriales bacterium]
MDAEKTISRRSLLEGAGTLGTIALALGAPSISSFTTAFADEVATTPSQALDDRQVVFTFKSELCTSCGACVDACRKYNNTPAEMPARRKLYAYTLENGQELPITTSCMHCKNPSCVAVCPAKAIEKRSDGIVALHTERCIGCKYCYSACPFGVPHYTDEAMDKCDFCLGNGVEPGTRPRCATSCPTGALDAGRLRDVMARIEGSEGYVRLSASTDPSLYLA